MSAEEPEVERAARCYRRLLTLLPPELRQKAGDELEAGFRDEYGAALPPSSAGPCWARTSRPTRWRWRC